MRAPHTGEDLPERRAQSERARAEWHDFMRTRSHELREKLVRRYVGLARATAARMYRRRIDNSVAFEDFLQYAQIGLVEAIEHYDPLRAVPFESFASFRIRGAVLNGLASETEIAAQRAYWSRRERERFESSKQPGPANERPASVDRLVCLALSPVRRDLDTQDEIDVADETLASDPCALAELWQLKSAIRSLLPELPPRECELMRRHYEDQIEFQQIAAEWGVTKGRVSQLHARALQRLREMLAPAADVNSRSRAAS
jgi:RNA polymerase sigma factor FliA